MRRALPYTCVMQKSPPSLIRSDKTLMYLMYLTVKAMRKIGICVLSADKKKHNYSMFYILKEMPKPLESKPENV